MAKENTVLVIDVGGSSLKMAEFFAPEAGGALVLERYAVKEFDEELNDAAFVEVFSKTFQEMIRENAFISRQVRVSISSLNSFQRLSKLPPLMENRNKATQVVEAEAKQTVPYPLDEVTWDYQLIKHTQSFDEKSVEAEDDAEMDSMLGSVEEMEALFVAVKNDIITAMSTVLLDADFEILSIEIAPTAVYNAAKANKLGDESCEMILDMGGRSSSLIFVDGNRIFIRSIPIAGNTITAQIAKEFSINMVDAEEMKRRHCFVALGGAYEESESEVAATISKIARNVMTRLHGEINRSINSWRAQYNGNRPERMMITGGSSIIPYVPHFFNEKLQIPVEYLNTFPVITLSDSIDKVALQDVAHLFPPLVGMGVRHVMTCPVEIALVPKIIQAHRDLQQKKPYFYISAVCAILLLLLFYAGTTARKNYDRRLERLATGALSNTEEIAKQIKALDRELSDKKGAFEDAMDIADNRAAWIDLLNELQKVTPANMWFTEIDGLSKYGDDPMDMMGMMGMMGGPGGMSGMSGMPGGRPGMSGAPSGMSGARPGMSGSPSGAPSGMPGARPGMSGMPGGMPGMPGMMGGMYDPDSDFMMMEPPAVKWLRVKGHSLVLTPESAEGVEDIFRKNVEASEFFDHESGSYVNPELTVDAGDNNVTSFVIYIKLKNPIKQ